MKFKILLFLPLLSCAFVSSWLIKYGKKSLESQFGRNFSIFWNSPSSKCMELGVDLDLDKFGILHNEKQGWNGSVINIFYSSYGKWPYFGPNGEEINGGIPQRGNITAHLIAMTEHVAEMVPNTKYDGLAIIDWERWDPVWERNWDSRKVYQTESIEWAKEKYPGLPEKEAEAVAREHFEFYAKQWMDQTLIKLKSFRPLAKWGYYRFPDCHDNEKSPKCSPRAQGWDDETQWLWNASTAIFPSSYIQKSWKDEEVIGQYVQSRTLEAWRILPESQEEIPINHYLRIQYALTYDFLTDNDLYRTLGVAAAMGIDGAILWNDAIAFGNNFLY